jgi:biotin carboxylase
MRAWFNKSFSGTIHLIRALRAEGSFVLASHTGDSPMLADADERLIEPKNLVGEAYVEWALGIAADRKIDVFFPGKEAKGVARARARFAERGVRLVVAAEPDVLSLLSDKARFYADFDPAVCAVLPFRVATTLESFKAACAELSAGGPICMKPAKGVYGHGFRSLIAAQSLERLLEGDLTSLSLGEAERIIAAAPSPFRPILVMRYAGGAERSIDCLGHQGALVQAVVRRKAPGRSIQVIEDDPRYVEIARRATARYGLTGVYNIQTKDAGGEPYILEINPRPSGGIYVSMTSGLNYPLWAARLALGLARPSDVPPPVTGLRVAQLHVPVVVGR